MDSDLQEKRADYASKRSHCILAFDLFGGGKMEVMILGFGAIVALLFAMEH